MEADDLSLCLWILNRWICKSELLEIYHILICFGFYRNFFLVWIFLSLSLCLGLLADYFCYIILFLSKVYQHRNNSSLQSAIMVLMISVKVCHAAQATFVFCLCTNRGMQIPIIGYSQIHFFFFSCFYLSPMGLVPVSHLFFCNCFSLFLCSKDIHILKKRK